MRLVLLFVIMNLGSTIAGVRVIQNIYDVQYAHPVLMIMLLGVFHTLALCSMVYSGSNLDETLVGKLRISKSGGGMWLSGIIAFCATLFLSWVINMTVLLELPFFHCDRIAYTLKEPMIMQVMNILGLLSGIFILAGWFMAHFEGPSWM